MLKALKEYLLNWKTISALRTKSGCFISYRAHVQLESPDQVVLGEGTSIWPGTCICTQSVNKPIETKLVVGKHTYIGENNNIRLADATIRIGDHCMISQQVSLISTNHLIPGKDKITAQSGLDYNKAGITIGNDVWIGCNCVVLPGVSIGDGAVIGAGSVVTSNIPEYSIAVGNPARIVKSRN